MEEEKGLLVSPNNKKIDELSKALLERPEEELLEKKKTALARNLSMLHTIKLYFTHGSKNSCTTKQYVAILECIKAIDQKEESAIRKWETNSRKKIAISLRLKEKLPYVNGIFLLQYLLIKDSRNTEKKKG
ncbi:MAG: hypothetical protein GX786_07480 [Clostridiales bacterium]|nr:hypothetical protein [Clostridiales bacterium]